LILVVTFPMFWLLKKCFDESIIATNRIIDFIEQNEQLQQIITNYQSSDLYILLKNYADSWGYNVEDFNVNIIKTHLVDAIKAIGRNLTTVFGNAVTFASNIGTFVVSIGVFLSCLYYFLMYKSQLKKSIAQLSPFDNEDSKKIFKAIKDACNRTFVCSILIGLLHSFITFITFWVVDFKLKVIFSILSGFLAILPVFSSWLIWLPAAVLLFMQGRYLHAAFIFSSQVGATFFLDPIIYGYIPGANSYFAGLSVVLGISQFGIAGILLGPLCVVILMTMKEIYLSYMQGEKIIKTKKKKEISN